VKTDSSQPIYSATKVAAILKRHTAATPPSQSSDPIAALIYAFLLWEASTHQATAALERISKECVDFNEFRVCLPEEIAGMLGPRYPYVEERATRVRRALNDLYRREHKVSLDHVTNAGKREQRSYLENLDGMVPFVSSRLLVLHFGQPAVPVDDQLVDLFREAKLLSRDDVTASDLGAALSKSVTTLDEAAKMHHAFVAWADSVWSEDPNSLMKAKKVRTLMHKAAEAREAKARDEAARQERVRAEEARVEEEKAAAAAKKAARAAAKSIEAKPVKTDAKPVKPEAKPLKTDAKPLKTDAKPVKPEAKPLKTDAKPVKPDAKPVKPEAKPSKTDAKPFKTDAKPLKPDAKTAKPAKPDAKVSAKSPKPAVVVKASTAKPAAKPAEKKGKK
jgi:endonuclease III